MKTLDIIGYKRANIGKSETKKLRREGNVPCVIYGGKKQIHFYAPMILFRELVYTSDAHFVNLDIEGQEIKCILQDIQFHPVSEIILHADFLELHVGKTVKMDIPVHFVGESPGVNKGGALIKKRRLLNVQALPKNIPSHINVDLSELDFGRSVKVHEVKTKDFEILDTPQASIAVVEIPKSLRGKLSEESEETKEEKSENSTEIA